MATPLSKQELSQAIQNLPGWTLENDMITKTFQFERYLDGLAFASAVGTLAEAQNHHPDMLILWRKVKVSFTTHDAGRKVTQNDITIAQSIEGLGYPR